MSSRGAKKGERRGGREKGTPNKSTLARKAELAAAGLSPLDHMLAVLRDAGQPSDRRDWAAQQAAPYCHPRLSAIDHKGIEPTRVVFNTISTTMTAKEAAEVYERSRNGE